MAEWQQGALAGETEIAYLVALTEDADGDEAEPDDLDRWVAEHGFQADALLLDNDRQVIWAYDNANPEPISEAVTVVIDKQMHIRKVGGTFDASHDGNLALLQELLDE